MDSGPEFLALALTTETQGITLDFIQPGSRRRMPSSRAGRSTRL
jgi:hypothetical protein